MRTKSPSQYKKVHIIFKYSYIPMFFPDLLRKWWPDDELFLDHRQEIYLIIIFFSFDDELLKTKSSVHFNYIFSIYI